ncbi:hypothetical protein GQ43DRAFT_480240 [Delitschia confertaspora ATCC 74209]|uniref:Uncharacterized protein n=1 Tax=Delitschia confertaspora ATCC 74209 TaxID=1513339 RepID=A0A9P4JME6_9PLEO|nr:hypothetical protein GQ43DRAFT_480240 [Delitschia confertaspora ATCC 74209]
MSTTLELGRGVLRSLKAQLELELVTSITVSPQQDSIKLEQLRNSQLLSLILSGDAWVCRGSQFGLLLAVSIHERPLTSQKKEELAGKIINGPVWKQLNLRPSLSPGFPTNRSSPSESATLRININHIREVPEFIGKRLHRLSSEASPADMKPPDGILKLDFDGVHFSLQVRKLKRENQRKTPKRLKNTEEQNVFDKLASENLFDEPGDDYMLNSLGGTDDGFLYRETDASTDIYVNSQESILRNSKPADCRKRPGTFGPESVEEPVGATEEEILANLVEAAIRISISESCKISPSIKLMKNDFAGRLADVCPVLWSPDHLLALSQRNIFLPILCHSLARSAYSNCRSQLLKFKLKALPRPTLLLKEPQVPQENRTSDASSSVPNSFESLLWRFTQKRTKAKRPGRPLKLFAGTGPSTSVPVMSPAVVVEQCSFRETAPPPKNSDWLVIDDGTDIQYASDSETSDDDLHASLTQETELFQGTPVLINDTDSEVDLWNTIDNFSNSS